MQVKNSGSGVVIEMLPRKQKTSEPLNASVLGPVVPSPTAPNKQIRRSFSVSLKPWALNQAQYIPTQTRKKRAKAQIRGPYFESIIQGSACGVCVASALKTGTFFYGAPNNPK